MTPGVFLQHLSHGGRMGTVESWPESLITWGKDQVSPGSTGEGNSPVRLEGVEPGCTSQTLI